MEIQLVPQYKFDEMVKKISVQSIAEKDRAKDTVFFNNTEFVISGAIGSGRGTGWAEIEGHAVVDLENYKGDLPALSRSEHFRQCSEGKRKIGYQGQIIPFGQRKLVMCEMYKFRALKVEVQQELF